MRRAFVKRQRARYVWMPRTRRAMRKCHAAQASASVRMKSAATAHQRVRGAPVAARVRRDVFGEGGPVALGWLGDVLGGEAVEPGVGLEAEVRAVTTHDATVEDAAGKVAVGVGLERAQVAGRRRRCLRKFRRAKPRAARAPCLRSLPNDTFRTSADGACAPACCVDKATNS